MVRPARCGVSVDGPRREQIEQLRLDLLAARQRLLDTISGVTEEQFKRRPDDPSTDSGKGWSIAEVLAHLLASEKLRADRITLALRQDGASITPSSPESHHEGARVGRVAPVPQLIHGLLATRRQVEHLLAQAADVDNGLDRSVHHPVHGTQTVGWMLREKIIDHEHEHVEQIEALKPAADPKRAGG
jgi:hypothetical protein